MAMLIIIFVATLLDSLYTHKSIDIVKEKNNLTNIINTSVINKRISEKSVILGSSKNLSVEDTNLSKVFNKFSKFYLREASKLNVNIHDNNVESILRNTFLNESKNNFIKLFMNRSTRYNIHGKHNRQIFKSPQNGFTRVKRIDINSRVNHLKKSKMINNEKSNEKQFHSVLNVNLSYFGAQSNEHNNISIDKFDNEKCKTMKSLNKTNKQSLSIKSDKIDNISIGMESINPGYIDVLTDLNLVLRNYSNLGNNSHKNKAITSSYVVANQTTFQLHSTTTVYPRNIYKVTIYPRKIYEATSVHSPNIYEVTTLHSQNITNLSNFDEIVEVFKSRYPVKEWISYGFFTEDFLYTINEHWLQFPPPRRSSHYILAALYFIVMTIGVSGNCLVIFMFLRCKSLQTPANVLVMNLAVSDFFLLFKMPIFIFNSFYFGPVLGATGCQLYGFIGGLTGTVSIMTLAAIALDRYYVIVYPLDPLRRTTRQRARICVIFVWFYGSIFAGLPLTGLGLNHYVPEGYLTSCSFDYLTPNYRNRMFIFIFFVAAWVIPFLIITFCYFGICRGVVKASGALSRHGQEHEKRKTELRLAGVVIGIVGLWFVSWTPYSTVALLGISGHQKLISPLTSMLPALFCKTASCIDPYIYAVTHPRFRRELMKLFCWRTRKKRLQRIQGSRITCWRTGLTQPGVGVQTQRSELYSEGDIEEIVMMVNTRQRGSSCSSSEDEQRKMCRVSFPMSKKASQNFVPPSWFVSPKPKKCRSTSMRSRPRVLDIESTTVRDPISI